MARNSKWQRWWLKSSNAAVGFLVGTVGLDLMGARILSVRGRTSGRVRSVPVNPFTFGGAEYLLSPRGETNWVRNLRVAQEGTLRRGREIRPFRLLEEVADADKLHLIRAYLNRWYGQVGKLMSVPKDADDDALRKIAANHPVFRIVSN